MPEPVLALAPEPSASAASELGRNSPVAGPAAASPAPSSSFAVVAATVAVATRPAAVVAVVAAERLAVGLGPQRRLATPVEPPAAAMQAKQSKTTRRVG